jgi:OOP family OmpA-OmpF porin
MGCSLVTVKQDPFPTMTVTAEAPKPPPPPPPKRVEVTKEKIKINEKIQFAFDSAEIREESFSLLNEIAQVMKDNPQILKVSVEGHTDTTGKASYNRKLSERRAKSVVEFLSKAGVDKGRMDPKGFGPDRLLPDLGPEDEAHRRVEFNIIERAPEGAGAAEGGDEKAEEKGDE